MVYTQLAWSTFIIFYCIPMLSNISLSHSSAENIYHTILWYIWITISRYTSLIHNYKFVSYISMFSFKFISRPQQGREYLSYHLMIYLDYHIDVYWLDSQLSILLYISMLFLNVSLCYNEAENIYHTILWFIGFISTYTGLIHNYHFFYHLSTFLSNISLSHSGQRTLH